MNWQTVIGDQNIPLVGDRIFHKDNIHGHDVARVGIVERDASGFLVIVPAYYNIGNDFAHERKVETGLVWALSERRAQCTPALPE